MSEAVDSAPARPGKASTAFRTIGEVADDLDLPAQAAPAAMPTLVPLDAAGPEESTNGPPEAPPAPPRPARRPRRRPTSPESKAALEEIRRDLIEARDLLDQMRRRPGTP